MAWSTLVTTTFWKGILTRDSWAALFSSSPASATNGTQLQHPSALRRPVVNLEAAESTSAPGRAVPAELQLYSLVPFTTGAIATNAKSLATIWLELQNSLMTAAPSFSEQQESRLVDLMIIEASSQPGSANFTITVRDHTDIIPAQKKQILEKLATILSKGNGYGWERVFEKAGSSTELYVKKGQLRCNKIPAASQTYKTLKALADEQERHFLLEDLLPVVSKITHQSAADIEAVRSSLSILEIQKTDVLRPKVVPPAEPVPAPTEPASAEATAEAVPVAATPEAEVPMEVDPNFANFTVVIKDSENPKAPKLRDKQKQELLKVLVERLKEVDQELEVDEESEQVQINANPATLVCNNIAVTSPAYTLLEAFFAEQQRQAQAVATVAEDAAPATAVAGLTAAATPEQPGVVAGTGTPAQPR